jgi:hypothetical protein
MTASVTLNATTIEGQLMELVTAIQIKENDAASNPNNQNRVTGSFNSDNGTFTGTFNLQIQQTVDATGKPTFTALEYLA